MIVVIALPSGGSAIRMPNFAATFFPSFPSQNSIVDELYCLVTGWFLKVFREVPICQ